MSVVSCQLPVASYQSPVPRSRREAAIRTGNWKRAQRADWELGTGSELSERPPVPGFSATDSYSPAGAHRSVDPRPRHHPRRRPDPGGRRRGICHGVGPAACTHRPEAGAGSSAADRNPDDDDDGVARAGVHRAAAHHLDHRRPVPGGQSSESLSSPWRRRSCWISPSPQSF